MEQELDGMLTKIEIDSAYTCEKLQNLHVLLTHLFACDNDLEEMDTFDSSATSIEKALTFDMLCCILESELKEMDKVLDEFEAEIVDTSCKLWTCEDGDCTRMEGKLIESADSLKQSREQVSEITLQLAKIQRTSEFSGNNQDLRPKYAIKFTEVVSSEMEEASEFTGLSKEVLGHIQILQFSLNRSAQRESELKSKLEDCITQLEAKDLLVQKLEGRISDITEMVLEVLTLKEYVMSAEEKLNNTDIELKNVNTSKQEILKHLSELETANECVKEISFDSEIRAENGENDIEELQAANIELTEKLNFLKDGDEEKTKQIDLLEKQVRELKETIEIRDENGESDIEELKAANLELTEELNFLKDGDEEKTKQIDLLEKQVRELEDELTNFKVSLEASQEQQNMLYSAIWDMETLIEDLKSKAAKAESRKEKAEEKCSVISTTNSVLNKEVAFLKQKAKSLEALLDLASDEKAKNAKEITARSKLLMDMVMQLSSERERIQEQLCSLGKENEKLRMNQCSMGNKYQRNGSYAGDKELTFQPDGHGGG